jgi:PHP-associated
MASRTAALLLTIAIVVGTAEDRARRGAPLVLGGYRVLAGDFHMHSSMWRDGALTPWGLVLEAERQGLDAIAITGHDELFDSRVGRWFSTRIGGPIVLVGEEILTPWHHVIAIGVEQLVDPRLDVADQVDEIHRQGGVAIAAHPIAEFSPGFDETAVRRLDGAEICHPLIYVDARVPPELERFAARAPLAAIGSSDYHGLGRLGMCRTYVFARDATPAAVIDAIRGHRTVVYGAGGKAYGDPALVRLAETQPRLRAAATTDERPGALEWVSRTTGIAGLLVLCVAAAKGPGSI